MGEHVIKLPDVGEGVAEAELVEWHVKVGDLVREDAVLAAVMTDKATVEIPSPVDGEVLWLGAEIGDTVAVGSPLVRLKVAGEGDAAADAAPSRGRAEHRRRAAGATSRRSTGRRSGEAREPPPAAAAPASRLPARSHRPASSRRPPPRAEGEKPLASPAVRLRAREAGIDLRQVRGHRPGRPHHAMRISTPSWRAAPQARQRRPGLPATTAVEEIKVVGLRRKIAEKMALAKSRIPAHHLCRGDRRHRARGSARRAEREPSAPTGRS